MERWNAGTAKYIGHFYKLPVWKIKTINNNIRHFYDILIFCLHLFDCQSVIMPALFPPFAQKSTAHKSQNLYKAIYRSALYLSTLLIFFNYEHISNSFRSYHERHMGSTS